MLKDDGKGDETVKVVYKGSVPDAFASGGEVVVDGKLRRATSQATATRCVAKCPSKYRRPARLILRRLALR